jgi:hypothetical protein
MKIPALAFRPKSLERPASIVQYFFSSRGDEVGL